jgi:hypothetical protein
MPSASAPRATRRSPRMRSGRDGDRQAHRLGAPTSMLTKDSGRRDRSVTVLARRSRAIQRKGPVCRADPAGEIPTRTGDTTISVVGLDPSNGLVFAAIRRVLASARLGGEHRKLRSLPVDLGTEMRLRAQSRCRRWVRLRAGAEKACVQAAARLASVWQAALSRESDPGVDLALREPPRSRTAAARRP